MEGIKETMKDLSYSGVVKIIQEDEIVASEFLYDIAVEMDIRRMEIKRLESELSAEKSRAESLGNAKDHVMKHLGKQYPIHVLFNETIVHVTNGDIRSSSNIISNRPKIEE